MVICVEFGPGMRLVAPIMSRNSAWSIHFLLSTISDCIMAMWAAGPPKLMQPSLKNIFASWVRRGSLFMVIGVV